MLKLNKSDLLLWKALLSPNGSSGAAFGGGAAIGGGDIMMDIAASEGVKGTWYLRLITQKDEYN
jgi:hypothetical protein